MKRISFNKINDREIFDLVSQHRLFTIMAAFLIFGMVLGSISMKSMNEDSLSDMASLFLNSLKVREDSGLFMIFVKSVSSYFLFAIIAFALGLSVWGFVMTFALMIFRGFGLGVSVGFLFFTYGFKGILFYALILLPGIFVSSMALILMSRAAFDTSYTLFKTTFLQREGNKSLENNFKAYFKKSGFALTLIIIASILDLLGYVVFSGFFNF